MAPTEGRVATLPGLNGGGAATRYPPVEQSNEASLKNVLPFTPALYRVVVSES